MGNMKLLQEFPYLYETHMHTKESSACAVESAVDMAKAYKNAGYSGLFITNHNWGGNTSVDRSLPWNEWIDKYFEPYYVMREWGNKNDFSVFCGMETGYDGPEFLIFGLEPEYWHAHPEFHDATPDEQLEIVHRGGGLVFQAHPLRQAFYIKEIRLFPDCVDGVEAINASHSSPFSQAHNNKKYNDEAVIYAKEHGFVCIGGSDCHSTNILYGGMAFKNKLNNADDFCNVMRRYIGQPRKLDSGNVGADFVIVGDQYGAQREEQNARYDYLIVDGLSWYSPYGDAVMPVSWED